MPIFFFFFQVTIRDPRNSGSNQIRFLGHNLTGTLFIIQCIDDCNTSCGSGRLQETEDFYNKVAFSFCHYLYMSFKYYL